MLFRDREPVTSFSLGNVDIGDEAGSTGYVSPLLQGNTGDYITPLISTNRDIEIQEVQEVQEEVEEEYRTPLISRTRDIEIYTQQPYSGQCSTVQYSTVQYSTAALLRRERGHRDVRVSAPGHRPGQQRGQPSWWAWLLSFKLKYYYLHKQYLKSNSHIINLEFFGIWKYDHDHDIKHYLHSRLSVPTKQYQPLNFFFFLLFSSFFSFLSIFLACSNFLLNFRLNFCSFLFFTFLFAFLFILS